MLKLLGPLLAVTGFAAAAAFRFLLPGSGIFATVWVLSWYALGAAGTFLALQGWQTAEASAGRCARYLASPAARALVALLLILYLGVLFNADGAFFKGGTHRDALRQTSIFGILALGMTLVIICGGIDLSVGSVVGLVSVLFSMMLIRWGWPAAVAVPGALAAGLACGSVAGVLTARLQIQPFIATLAMMAFARGLAKRISGGMKISNAVENPDGTFRYVDLPAIFGTIDSNVVWKSISVVTIIFLACAAVAWVALACHRWGRQLYAIGGNEEAARLSGIPVRRARIMAYAAAGLLSAVAGICQAAQDQHGDPEAGNAYELTAIAIVVIGGTNLLGGSGGIGLTLIGTLTIGYLEKILSINAVPAADRLMWTAVIIVTAVLAQRRRL